MAPAARSGSLMMLCGVCVVCDQVSPFPSGWNGLAAKPPMGWRPWNSLRAVTSQATMKAAVDAVATWNRTVKGVAGLASLCDFGYCDDGITEGYELTGPGNHSMHDRKGNVLIKRTAFPDMAALIKYAHAKNLTMGWYLNSCAYCGPQNDSLTNYEGDVRNMLDIGFDGVKVDGCGKMNNRTLYAQLMKRQAVPSWWRTATGVICAELIST